MVTEPVDAARAAELRAALVAYAAGRRQLLEALRCPTSMRDPLAEFAEQFVAALLGGELASSRVQKGWDLVDRAGRKVQVRYVANPIDTGAWRNEHLVSFDDDVAVYALVVFEALDVAGVLAFERDQLGDVCRALGKRHPDQGRQLQFTRRNFEQIVAEQSRFATLGVAVYAGTNV